MAAAVSVTKFNRLRMKCTIICYKNVGSV